jgi:hypothetical protein
MRLIIKDSAGHTLGEVEDYTGWALQEGDYIYVPPRSTSGTPTNVMTVKAVTHGILGRQPGVDCYVGAAHPYVEVQV